MKVLKFGGTSVGSIESMQSVKQIVESCKEDVVVVVSALGGITDKLILTARTACEGKAEYTTLFTEMLSRHNEMIAGILSEEKQAITLTKITPLFDELENILKGVYLIRDLSAKTYNIIVSYGERLSSVIVADLIEGAVHFDSREFIKTEIQFNKAICDLELTGQLINKAFTKQPHAAVVSGFISTDKHSGEITNLGRGGSDYTAAILAAALKADILEIWTDVDGFLTADPRVINNTYVIDELSFVEAMELCNFGAKVIYPPTIYPVYHANIPIVIKNTFNPSTKGSYISRKQTTNPSKAIKGISSINDTSLITVRGLGMVGVIGVNYRIFKALSKAGISVFLVSQAASENNTSIGVKDADAELAVQVLKEEFSNEIRLGEIHDIFAENDLATVAIVGENMKHTPGIAGKLFGTLGRNGISVIACAQGASETNISFVIEKKSLRKALNVIHDSFFLSDYQVLNLVLIGTGTVGGSLIDQIEMQQPLLMQQNRLRLNVVGIADADHCLFTREGINLKNWKEALASAEVVSSPEVIRNSILEMNIFNSVFVDCTASPKVAEIYEDLLMHNVSVVTANKIAASGPFDRYCRLKEIARKRGVKFLFETNVGAGLPIINTMNALCNSGDKILKIEAVLSGTLNYIFNTLSAEIPLSQTIRMAMEAGYAEPDPRIDLSGTDVIRKLVILSREAGYQIEQSDVIKNLFVPNEYFEGSIDNFWQNITKLDAEFEEKRQRLAAQEKRFRFVAKMDNGVTSVGLEEVDSENPLFHLEGSNNIILITTERYNESPMIIKGYGAGASVTAAGVFADVISIANIR